MEVACLEPGGDGWSGGEMVGGNMRVEGGTECR